MKVYDEGKEQEVSVGDIEDNVFTRHVKRDGEFYFRREGYAFQATLMYDWTSKNVTHIHISEQSKEHGIRDFWITLANFRKHMEMINHGHGPQFVVPLSKYKPTKEEA